MSKKPAWEADVLPLNYARKAVICGHLSGFGVDRNRTGREQTQRRNKGEELSRLLVEFLDIFYTALGSGGADALIAEEPEALPNAQEQALLGAVGEHLARRWDLPIPEWTNDRSRFLSRPYFTTPVEGLKALLIAESPLAFRQRPIFTEGEPLRRATMPRGRVKAPSPSS